MEEGPWWSGNKKNTERNMHQVPEFCLLNNEKIWTNTVKKEIQKLQEGNIIKGEERKC